MSRNYVVLAAILLAVFADCGLPTHAAEKDAKEQSSLTFKGKVLLLIIDRSSALEKKSDTEYLSDAVVQKLGDRYFITGAAYSWKDDAAKDRHDWRKGSQIGVAWEKVQQYYVFSPERMDEIMKKRQEDEKQ
jgi:hypothetical protein